MLKQDVLYTHNDDLSTVVSAMSWVPQGVEESTEWGYKTHSAIPVLELDDEKVDNRENFLIDTLLARSSGKNVPAEVLPGELICTDNVIRRESAVRAMMEQPQQKEYKSARKVSIGVARLAAKDGKMVVWRPTGSLCDYAWVIEAEGDE